MNIFRCCISICGLLCMPHIVAAQCHLHQKTDDFTGKTSIWSDKIKITFGGVSLLFKGNDGDCTYRVYFRFVVNNGRTFISLSEDSDCYCVIASVSLKFTDGSVLIKKNWLVGQSIKTVLGEEHFSLFELTQDELRLLSASTLKQFKITEPACIDHPVIEEEFDKRDARDIKDMALCIGFKK